MGGGPETILPIKTLEALKTMQAGDGARSQSVTRRIAGDTNRLSNIDISNPYRSTIHQFDKRKQAEILYPKGAAHATSMKEFSKDSTLPVPVYP